MRVELQIRERIGVWVWRFVDNNVGRGGIGFGCWEFSLFRVQNMELSNIARK